MTWLAIVAWVGSFQVLTSIDVTLMMEIQMHAILECVGMLGSVWALVGELTHSGD